MTSPPSTVPIIISASRRTDVPAFYMPWLMARLRAGSATYPNPFNKQPCQVSLRPDDVHSIVFWSKSFRPFLPHMDALDSAGYHYVCHYTITGAPRTLEPRVPDWRVNLEVFRALAGRIGPRRVLWRFDPIVLTDTLDAAYYAARFEMLARALTGYTERCYFSFATYYAKAARRLAAAGVAFRDPPLDERLALVRTLTEMATACGITLLACCQPELAVGNVRAESCVDAGLLAELFPDRPLHAEARPTRPGCGCAASRDIGVYDTCLFGCRYCYATNDDARAAAWHGRHDPSGEQLIPPSSQ
ncbi:MAG: DUF1848 family protein [Anaerolineae bacterium]|nr:DUF1848 family protein [Anaerolineae bacterium]